MFEQLPYTDGTDVLDHVENNQRLPGLHAIQLPVLFPDGKRGPASKMSGRIQGAGEFEPSIAFDRLLLSTANAYPSVVIRLVLFDIDGTLIRTRGAGVRAFERTFASEFNIRNGTGRIHFAGRTDTSLAREMFVQHDVPPTSENFRRFFDAYVHWLDFELGRSEGGTCPGVWEFVRALRNLPDAPAIGLLTGNIRLGAEIKLRHFELWEVFQTGAFADDDEDRDRIAALAQERGARLLDRKLPGEEILVVGDTPRDVRCARSIRARMLAVGTGGASIEELAEQKPDWLIEDLSQVDLNDICR